MGCCQSSKLETPLLRRSQFVKNRNATVKGFYNVIELLKRGSYSAVSRVCDKRSGLIRAMKEINKTYIPKGKLMSLKNEIAILADLDHPNIMKVFEILESEKYLNIFCEYLEGGQLFEVCAKHRTLNEKTTRRYIFDVLSGLNYLHDNKVVHGDIKLENLVLESNSPNSRLKITDFGISQKLVKPLHAKHGTRQYMAPEIFKGKYDEKIDNWSVGVLIYVMISGEFPFKYENEEGFIQVINNASPRMERGPWSTVSDECKDLVRKLLNPDPNKRFTASRALRHPWMKREFDSSFSSIQSSYCENIKSFKVLSKQKSNKVITSFLVYIASQMLTSDEELEIAKVFRAFDTDGNGKISRDELSSGFKLLDNGEVDRLFENCDFNKNGFINYTEFLTVCMDWNHVLNKEKEQMVFKYFESCGSMSLDELRASFTNVSEEEWGEFLRDVDANGDGEISLREFRDYIVRYIEI